MARNIIITGFMGVGKSTVGRMVGYRLSREFIDADSLIEEQEGRPIPQIFAEEGEPYFRALEAAVCRKLAGRTDLVIATGGGMLVPAQNLQVMARTGLVICLDCNPAVLWERIGRSKNRPMLAEDDPGRFERLQNLLTERAEAYARIPHHLDVTDLAPVEVAREIIDLAEMHG